MLNRSMICTAALCGLTGVLAIGLNSNANATTISVDGSAILNTGYESDTPGDAPAGFITPNNPTLVTDAAAPGAFSGSNYLDFTTSGAGGAVARHAFASPVTAIGSVVEVDTMIYLSGGVPIGTPWYQMLWFDASGTTSGINNSPVHTAFFGDANGNHSLQFYNGSAFVDTGLTANSDEWTRLTVSYEVGGNEATATINGQSATGVLNSNPSDPSISSVQFFTIGSSNPTDKPMYLDAVPEPSSLALLGLGGLLIARRRR